MSQPIKDSNIHIIDLSVSTPKAEAIEKRNKEWVSFGADNNYYDTIVNLFDNSNMNRRILLNIRDRIVGEGLISESYQNKVAAWSDLNQFFSRKEVSKVALDEAIFTRYALKLTTNRAGTKIVKVEHFPVNCLRPEKQNEYGKIEAYYYSKDWHNTRARGNEPKRMEVFDFDKTKQVGEFIFVSFPYSPSSFYLNPVEYNGGLTWMQSDIEIGNYHLSNIQTGFSGATIFQFFNGEPDETSRRKNEHLLKQKYSGARGDKLVFVYNEPDTNGIKIENIKLTDADKQYEVLSNEINTRIMLAHGVTSPMLLGIRQETGLGNNADEIQTANALFERTVIRPKQLHILYGIERILNWNGQGLQVNFRPYTILGNVNQQDDQTTQLSRANKHRDSRFDILTDDDQDYILDYLEHQGEDEQDLLTNGFKLYNEDDCDGDDKLKIKGEQLKSIELQSAWGLTPNNLSKYDVKAPDGSGVWLVRYQYALASTEPPPAIIPTSRKFCRQMIDAAVNGNRVYKREVLENLNNTEFGSYNIFWYKGSYNCRHVWKRKLYFKSNDSNVVNPVGNVPYVVNRLSDKRATSQNTPVKR